MTDTTLPVGATVAEDAHRAHLRRAVVASTVGTTIEWYDFLIYSTMTGLVDRGVSPPAQGHCIDDGQILVSSRSAGAVEALVRLEDLGNLELKA